jgi:signal transduction histidine kinase/CheY-like chemotaxis protein
MLDERVDTGALSDVAPTGLDALPLDEADVRLLLGASIGAALILDPALRIVQVTDGYRKLFPNRLADVVGMDAFDYFREVLASGDNSVAADEQAKVLRNLRLSLERVRRSRVADTVAVQRYDLRRPAGDGFEERYWSTINSPVLDGRRQLVYIIHRVEDVTEFVKNRASRERSEALAAELQARTAGMELEMLRRASELQDANAQLLAANAAKNEFLSRMSHELRTPLNAICGFSELLTIAGPNEDPQELAGIILRAGKHLTLLIDEVLEISKIEEGQITISLEPVAIEPLLDEVLALVAPLAARFDVIVHPPRTRVGSRYAYADSQRLKQVLINLVSNAIKYNRPGGEVFVTTELAGQDRVRISVRDTGAGIDEKALAKLFTPFERLDAAARGIEGTGLGLALSSKLVDAMGGALEVTSTLGEGSTFCVELAGSEPDAVQVARDEAAELLGVRSYSGERRLVYVEDVVANVRLLEEVLRRRPSIQLFPATLGELGLELAREHRPDMILLDLHLPDLTGADVLRRLQADRETADIPVVMLTADSTRTQARELLDAGAQAYLTKPMQVRRLLELLDQFMDT